MPLDLIFTGSRISFEQEFWIPGLYENLLKALDLSSYTLNFHMILEFTILGGPKSLGQRENQFRLDTDAYLFFQFLPAVVHSFTILFFYKVYFIECSTKMPVAFPCPCVNYCHALPGYFRHVCDSCPHLWLSPVFPPRQSRSNLSFISCCCSLLPCLKPSSGFFYYQGNDQNAFALLASPPFYFPLPLFLPVPF